MSPSILIVDVRDPGERYQSGLGFIPGSIRAPTPEAFAQWVENAQSGSEVVVATCLSDARSRQWCDRVATVDLPPTAPEFELAYLEGGVMGWAAEGLPLAGLADVSADPVMDLDSFRRQLTACFVAEMVQTEQVSADVSDGFDREENSDRKIDPLAMLRRCFRAAQAPWDNPTPLELADVLDHAARASQKAGTPAEVVRANLDRMLRRLPGTPDGFVG